MRSNVESDEIDHEIGHLIEYHLLDKKAVDEYKKYLVEGVTCDNIYVSYEYGKPIYLIKGGNFISEYQSRLYIRDINEAINPDKSINTDYMLESISELLRVYYNEPNKLSKDKSTLAILERILR